MCDVLFPGGGKIKLDFFPPTKKAVDAFREVVPIGRLISKYINHIKSTILFALTYSSH